MSPPRPIITSTPQPPSSDRGINGPYHTENSIEQNIHQIGSVVEGVAMLERYLREYIHQEILLTDRFRFEMRMKQHMKKAHGFTSQGISEARVILGQMSAASSGGSGIGMMGGNGRNCSPDNINSNNTTMADMFHKLKNQLERISTEYDECSRYMDKVVSSMAQFEDVENFLNTLKTREKEYKKDLEKKEKIKEKGKGKSKGKKGNETDSYESLVEMFKMDSKYRKKYESKNRGYRGFGTRNFDKTGLMSSNRDHNLILPSLTKSNRSTISKEDERIKGGNSSYQENDSLLAKLKILVANYEIVRLRMLTTEDRFRRDASRRDRKNEMMVRTRDDEIYRLQTLLREAEAEAEKYKRLYDNTKLGAGKKKG